MLVPRALVSLLVASLGIVPESPRNAARMPINWVPDPQLVDAALAVSDGDRATIYYNPRILQRIGPSLTAFVFAHEEAHIALGHRRAPGATAEELRVLELAADCEAARRMRAEQPAALSAAIRHFQAQGPRRADTDHPTGDERAVRLLACADAKEPETR